MASIEHGMSGQQGSCSSDSVPGEDVGAGKRKAVRGNITEGEGGKRRKMLGIFVPRRKCPELKWLPSHSCEACVMKVLGNFG